MTLPVAAPKADPDEKVANAKERAGEGGNAWAKIPSWVTRVDQNMRMTIEIN